VRVSAKTDYAIRAALELAAAEDDRPVKGERIATAQAIPLRFLENILMQLRHDGPLAGVQGERPETLGFTGVAEPMRDVWIAVRASLRAVLEQVTLADVVSGELPEHVRALLGDEDAWVSH
jgi:DNA-binding IscR family transcriptional regulator